MMCANEEPAVTYTVLIVDDSKLARMSVVKALSALPPDWPRLEAANAEEALLQIESATSLVLGDVLWTIVFLVVVSCVIRTTSAAIASSLV